MTLTRREIWLALVIASIVGGFGRSAATEADHVLKEMDTRFPGSKPGA
jgi:hypothetical protein